MVLFGSLSGTVWRISPKNLASSSFSFQPEAAAACFALKFIVRSKSCLIAGPPKSAKAMEGSQFRGLLDNLGPERKQKKS